MSNPGIANIKFFILFVDEEKIPDYDRVKTVKGSDTVFQEKESRKREEELIRYLSKGGHTYEDVLSHFVQLGYPITKASLKKDKERLNKLGFKIYSRKGILYLDNCSHLKIVTPSLDSSFEISVRQLTILLLLGMRGAMTFPEIREALTEEFDVGYWASDYIIRHNVLDPLRETGLIRYDRSKRLYESTFKGTLYEMPDEDSRLFQLLNGYYSLPENLYNTILSRLLADSFLLEEKERTDLARLPEYINKLNAFDYENNLLSFSCLTDKGKEQILPNFHVGIIAYSIERDCVYFIGRTSLSKNKHVHRVIRAGQILWDSLSLSTNNPQFQAEIKDPDFLKKIHSEYAQIKKEMFVVSPDPPQTIQVEIDYSKERLQDFTALVERRSQTASLTENDKTILYQDTIRGLGDFARFLRKYGDSVHVVSADENNPLKKQLRLTATQVLQKYEEKKEEYII